MANAREKSRQSVQNPPIVIVPTEPEKPAFESTVTTISTLSGPNPAELLERIHRLENLLVQNQPPVPDGYQANIQAVNPFHPKPSESKTRWFELPLLHDIKLIGQMYLDPRYRLSRLAQFGVPGIFLACLLNYLVFNYLIIHIPFLTPVAERCLLILLGMLLLILIRHETTRYRNVLEYLERFRPPNA